MKNKNVVWNYVIMYVFGILTVLAFTQIPGANAQNPITSIPLLNSEPSNTITPSNYFNQDQVLVYKDRVVLNAENIKWAKFTDTKSMLPVINKDSYALQIEPNCPSEIEIGDIVSYRSDYANGIIIHRVVHKDTDELGDYFVLKGDNNPTNDPGRIRCPQIDRKVVAIIY
jgi:signal peptidase I